jgi:hypothetical protein
LNDPCSVWSGHSQHALKAAQFYAIYRKCEGPQAIKVFAVNLLRRQRKRHIPCRDSLHSTPPSTPASQKHDISLFYLYFPTKVQGIRPESCVDISYYPQSPATLLAHPMTFKLFCNKGISSLAQQLLLFIPSGTKESHFGGGITVGKTE